MAKNDKKPAVSAQTAAVALQTGEAGGSVVVAAPTNISAGLPAGFKLKRLVTVPSLVLKTVNEIRYLRIDSEMRISKVEDKKQPKREPATICDATDMATGQVYIWLLPSVVKENLQRDYPDGSYVGKVFAVCNNGKRTESQRYNDFSIAELEAE